MDGQRKGDVGRERLNGRECASREEEIKKDCKKIDNCYKRISVKY